VSPGFPEGCPAIVGEYAARAVDYVRRAVGLELEYDSETLPVLDHYLRTSPSQQPAMLQLLSQTSGAYFGEVVRRRLGGRWDLSGSAEAQKWRMILPSGLSFAPVAVVASAILQADADDVDESLDSALEAPAKMRPFVERALERMADVTVECYYSLCGRLDTLEHLQEVLVAVAAQIRREGGLDVDDGEATDVDIDDGDIGPGPHGPN
jgi:hypothetical protein